jgi:3-oxoacyl-[acyl-carrier-protein] synthase-1
VFDKISRFAPMSLSPLRSPLYLPHFTATSCLGHGLKATHDALLGQRSGLAPCDFDNADLATWTGTVEGVNQQVLPAALSQYNCRNNRLAQLGLEQDGFAQAASELAARVGASRVGVFMGTSTSGIYETEVAYRQRDPATGALPAGLVYRGSHNPYSLAGFVRGYLGLTGPAVSISSACSSSGKVFASAWRMLDAGLIDAAVVGGVDSLCLTTLYGFGSLDVLSNAPCRPFDRARSGISIGEAAAFALVERTPSHLAADAVLLCGVGESSDAHHMSAPHPEGLGARLAMAQALAMGGADASRVSYINLHGTATPANDAAEGKAVASLFGERTVPCSSTKGATGHALGAAGGLEAVISALALRHGMAWGGVQTQQIDESIPVAYLLDNRAIDADMVLSNSFGFGGTNCSLLLGLAGRSHQP